MKHDLRRRRRQLLGFPKKECLPGPAVVTALLSPHNVHGGLLQLFVLKVGQDDSDKEEVLN